MDDIIFKITLVGFYLRKLGCIFQITISPCSQDSFDAFGS